MIRAAGALGAAALLVAGCAHDRVTLLDNEDGSAQFAVADITDPGSERVADGQLTELKLGSRGKAKQLDKVRERDAQLANTLPLKTYTKDFRFGTGEFTLDAAQLADLDKIKQAARERAPAVIEIEGFTDRTGDETFNLTVASNRALAVAKQLRAAGFDILDENIVARGEFEAKKQGDADETPNPNFRKVSVIVR